MSFSDFSRQLGSGRAGSAAAWVVVREVESTQLLARSIAAEYCREGSRPPAVNVLAWHQLAGRGRGGRRWSSPPGAGVYASLVRSLAAAEEVQKLPLQVALALHGVLDHHLGGRCRLKWPNDLRVAGRKLGGVLIESAIRPDQRPLAIIGFGVNLRSDAAGLGETAATSVEAETPAAAVPGLAELAEELVAAVDTALATAAETAELARRFAAASEHREGERLCCRQGEEVLEGTFRGIDERGFLRLEVAGGERRIGAGEVVSDA